MSNKLLDLNTVLEIQKKFIEIFDSLHTTHSSDAIIQAFNLYLHRTLKELKSVPHEFECFLLKTEECPICKKRMINKDKQGLFSTWSEYSQSSQLKLKGIAFKSTSIQDTNYICSECDEKGLAVFKCELCNETKPTSKIKKSYGDIHHSCVIHHLCVDCYETASVKAWEEKSQELWEKHRYDYE